MDIGAPDSKRPRLAGPTPLQWQNSPETSRQLPPPPTASYSSHPQHPPPFSRPEPSAHPLDRRHSGHTEHPPYDPQDPRRPHSGPSHGYHPHTGPPPPPPLPFTGQREPISRDLMVKRDPSDEPPPQQQQQQQQYRPSPTGNAPEHNVNPSPHHDTPGRPYLPPFDHPGPPPYRHNSYPPPSPMAANEPYPPHQMYQSPGLPPREPYPSVTYPSSAMNNTNQRKKATRAAQACDSCRTLKAKCDEGRPSCSSCREKGIECRYRDPP